MRHWFNPKYWLESTKGFTIAEVTITLFVSSLTLSSILFANTNIQKVSISTYQKMIALQDANQVIEQMRDASTFALFPSNVISAFPNGQAVTGFNHLQNETVTVEYNSLLDPLDVTVVVTWQDENLRTVSYQLNAIMTQRE